MKFSILRLLIVTLIVAVWLSVTAVAVRTEQATARYPLPEFVSWVVMGGACVIGFGLTAMALFGLWVFAGEIESLFVGKESEPEPSPPTKE